MPKSKRNKQVDLSKTKKHGLAGKKNLYNQIRSSVDDYAHIFVFSVNDMRNSKMKNVREQWKHSRFFIGKNKVMAMSLGRTEEDEYRPNLHKIGESLKGERALLFSNQPIEEVVNWFNSYVEGDYARSGNIATDDVILQEGPLTQFPHNLESYLRQLGLPTTLKKGVIHLVKDHVVCTVGDRLSPETARILKLLGYEMAEFRIKIESVWSQDGSFKDLKGDSSDPESKENIKKCNGPFMKKGFTLCDDLIFRGDDSMEVIEIDAEEPNEVPGDTEKTEESVEEITDDVQEGEETETPKVSSRSRKSVSKVKKFVSKKQVEETDKQDVDNTEVDDNTNANERAKVVSAIEKSVEDIADSVQEVEEPETEKPRVNSKSRKSVSQTKKPVGQKQIEKVTKQDVGNDEMEDSPNVNEPIELHSDIEKPVDSAMEVEEPEAKKPKVIAKSKKSASKAKSASKKLVEETDKHDVDKEDNTIVNEKLAVHAEESEGNDVNCSEKDNLVEEPQILNNSEISIKFKLKKSIKKAKKLANKQTVKNKDIPETKDVIPDTSAILKLTEEKIQESAEKPKKFSPKLTRSRAAAKNIKVKTPDQTALQRSARKRKM